MSHSAREKHHSGEALVRPLAHPASQNMCNSLSSCAEFCGFLARAKIRRRANGVAENLDASSGRRGVDLRSPSAPREIT